ncbi:MAG: peptidylprolyl isomerase [Candidatus Cloacimonadia bacterium]
MSKIRYLLFLSLIIILGCTNLLAEQLDRIVAKVGREIILESDLKRHRIQLEQMQILVPGTTDEEVLRDIVEGILVLQTAKSKGYAVDENKLRQTVDSQISSYIDRFGSESTLRAELRKSGMSLSDLREQIEQMVREQRVREMLIQNEITSRIHITDSELLDFYNEHIDEIPERGKMVELWMFRREIKASERTKRTVSNDINKIYDKIREGKDFAKLAEEYSDCPSSKMGGDLGFFGPGTMIKEFEDTAFKLKPGEISNVVETKFGYHIIKMEEKDEDDIRVRHILKTVEPTDKDIEENLNFCQEILDRLRAGEDFKAIAVAYSDDASKEHGGIIGEFQDEEMPELFQSSLNNIDIGEFTELVRYEQDVFIFGKTNLIPARKYRFAEVKDQLKDMLMSEKQADYYEIWIENLKKQAYVETFLN